MPLIYQFARNEEERQLFKLGLIKPNNVNAAGSCEGHEAAFQKTLRDPELIAAAQRSKLNISPISGAELRRMILESYRCRPAKVDDAD